MPSIVFLTRALDVGGAQRQLVELALGLHRIGWMVRVVTFYGGGPLESELRRGGVDVVNLGKRGRFDVFQFLWRLVSTLRAIRPHVVHAYLEAPNALIASIRPLLGGTRIVWGLRASDVQRTHYDALARVVSRAGASLSRFADLIICNSEMGRAHYASLGYCSDRMVVIRNGINTERFRPDVIARGKVRRELSITDTTRLIGCVARLDPMKDHANFLRAAAVVRAVRQDVRFVCVGGGPFAYRRDLEQTAKELGLARDLSWLDAREDIERIYNALDVAVSASAFGEGTSNAIAEAMATGVPSVATDVGDARAVIGDYGIVCPPGDSGALADAILKCLASPSDPRRTREHVMKNFGSDLLIKRSAEHLAALLPSASDDTSVAGLKAP